MRYLIILMLLTGCDYKDLEFDMLVVESRISRQQELIADLTVKVRQLQLRGSDFEKLCEEYGKTFKDAHSSLITEAYSGGYLTNCNIYEPERIMYGLDAISITESELLLWDKGRQSNCKDRCDKK